MGCSRWWSRQRVNYNCEKSEVGGARYEVLGTRCEVNYLGHAFVSW
jgi:hypothetical protein